MENKNYLINGISLLVVLLVSSSVLAFGVGFPYHKDHPLEISAGESLEVKFNFQNPAGEDLTVQPNIVKGAEVLSFSEGGDRFEVPLGSSVDLYALLIIPLDAKIGEVYEIQVDFSTVTESSSGSFGLGASVSRQFNVVVVPNEEERKQLAPEDGEAQDYGWVYLVLGVLAVLTIILLIVRHFKKRKESSSLGYTNN